MSGYIYAILCMDRVKIGFSKRPTERLAVLRGTCPYPVYLLGVKPGTKAEEKAVHATLAHIWTHGEWFQMIADPVLHEFLSKLSGFNDPIEYHQRGAVETEGQKKLRAWRFRGWGGDLGLTGRMFSHLQSGLARPKPELAAVIERQFGIPASSWVSEHKSESAA